MAIDSTLGRANVAIRATLDKLDGDLSGARGKVDSAVKSMVSSAGAAFQGVGTAALAGIGVATAAVAGLAAGLAKITIDAAPVEGIQTAFYGVAESAGIMGDEMLAALQKGSSGMIPARDLMLSFNKAASLVGKDFAVQLPDAMKYLGKVSAATGQDMGFLMDSLVVGVGRLSPMILDNLGIQVSLAEATERAAEMFGVEASELDKTQQQAGMMSVALEKLEKNTAAMPDITETATAKMAQMKAQFQDTKDEIGMAFLPVLKTVIDTIGKVAEKVLPPLLEILDELAPVFQTVADAVGDFVLAILDGESPLDAFKILLQKLFPPEVGNKIMEIVRGIQEFLAGVKEVLAPIVEWVQNNVELQDVLIVLAAAIMSVVLPIIWSLIASVAPVILAFMAAVAVVALLRQAWESDFLGIRTFVEETLAKIKEWWSAHGDEVIAKAKQIYEDVKARIQTAIETIKQFIQNALANINAWWAEHGEAIKAKAKEIWDSVVAVFEWFKGIFSELFEAFKLAQQGRWYEFGEKLREIWNEIWERIKEIVGAAWEKLKEIVSGLIQSIKEKFTSTDWGALGRAIINGIVSGVKAVAGRLAQAAINAAKAALDAAKGFLGVKSPSKVFEEQVGEMSVEGWIQGLESGRAKIQATSLSLARASVPNPPSIPGDMTMGGSSVIEGLLSRIANNQSQMDEKRLALLLRDALMQVAT